MIKVDLHVHTDLDPIDGKSARQVVKHSCDELFAEAKSQGFDAISLTHHVKRIFTKEIEAAAKKYGILPIPGAEIVIGKAHVLLINTPHDKVHTFEDLAKLKKEHPEVLVIAPHPFFPGAINLRKHLHANFKLFDAIEYSHYYFRGYNGFNKKAQAAAEKYKLPLVGTGDVHYLFNFGYTYTVVDTPKKDIIAICEAIKSGKCRTVSQPLPFKNVVKSALPMMLRLPKIIFGTKSYSSRAKSL